MLGSKVQSFENDDTMIYFISSVSDHGKFTIILKLSIREFINVYFGNFQWVLGYFILKALANGKATIFLFTILISTINSNSYEDYMYLTEYDEKYPIRGGSRYKIKITVTF